MGGINLVDFVVMHPSLPPNFPGILREKVVGEKSINIMESEVVRLGDILGFFKRGREISSRGPYSFFYLREFT